jgi:integrase/recombinase XerD
MSLDTVSVKVVLKTGKIWLNKKGEYPVKLRLTYLGKQKFYTVRGESATKEDFKTIINPNSKGKNKTKRLEFEAIEFEVNKIIKKLDQFSFDAFEYEYLNHKKKNTTIQEYFEDKEKELESVGKVGTATGYRATIVSLTKFDKNISFQKITPKYLKKYENWFVEQGKSYTSVGIYMRNLRHIVNLAIEDRLIKSYPFGEAKDKYQIPVSNNTKKALNLSEIALLFNYKTDIEQELTSLKYWLFSYLCNGMNFVDILNLKYSNIEGDTLKFIRQKTKDTSKHKTKIDVVLLPETFEIIEQLGNPDKASNNYIFPILNDELTAKDRKKLVAQHIQTTNKYIKRIAESIGINAQISTYYARHSYSTIIRDSGASTEFIAEQLGHQSTKVTQSYLDSFPKESKKKFQQSIIPIKATDIL